MEPITLAAVTTAVVTLALEAARDVAPQIAKDTWTKVKDWLGFTEEPATADLAIQVATALSANTAAAEKIIAELKAANLGTASKLASKVTLTVSNKAGNMRAGGDMNSVQAGTIKAGGDFKLGGR